MRVSPVIGRVGGGPTYDSFLAHISALAINGPITSWGIGNVEGNIGARLATAAPFSGNLFDSSWGRSFPGGSSIARIVQHGMPSAAAASALASAGQKLLVRIAYGPQVTAFFSFNRNGYASLEYFFEEPINSYVLTELIFWDAVMGQAVRMQPSASLGPTPYTW